MKARKIGAIIGLISREKNTKEQKFTVSEIDLLELIPLCNGRALECAFLKILAQLFARSLR